MVENLLMAVTVTLLVLGVFFLSLAMLFLAICAFHDAGLKLPWRWSEDEHDSHPADPNSLEELIRRGQDRLRPRYTSVPRCPSRPAPDDHR